MDVITWLFSWIVGPTPKAPAPVAGTLPPKIFDFTDHRHNCPEAYDAVVTTTEWGLELPSGEVQWGSWGKHDFATPLDRLRMVGSLKRQAWDIGLSEGTQSDEFLNNYKWRTREQRARITYRNTDSFSLTDPAASTAPVENFSHEQPQDDSEIHVLDSATYSHRKVHSGYLGGDA
jgi:hypothetical protein